MGALAVMKKRPSAHVGKTAGEMTADELRDAYIRKLARPLNKDDLSMIEMAMEMARLKCKNRRSHTYCVVKGRKDFYGKPQLNCSRGREFNQCSEPSAVADAVDNDDVVVKLVVIHYKKGYTRRTAIVPCSKCIEILRRFSIPNATVIMKYKGQWMKFPVRRFFLFPYPTQYKNKRANI